MVAACWLTLIISWRLTLVIFKIMACGHNCQTRLLSLVRPWIFSDRWTDSERVRESTGVKQLKRKGRDSTKRSKRDHLIPSHNPTLMLLWNKCTLGDMKAGGAEWKREMKECGCSITVFIAVCRHGWPFLSAVCVMEAVSDDSDQMFEKPWAQETLKTTLTVQNQSRQRKCHELFFFLFFFLKWFYLHYWVTY